jgi:hypothetical protein
MKKIFTFFVCLSAALSVAFSQDLQYSSGFIQRFNQAKEASKLKNVSHQAHMWKSQFLWEAQKNWDRLTPEAKLLVKPGYMKKSSENRPMFTDEKTYNSAHFVFHYEISGAYAVDNTDENSDGVPDYVSNMASLFEGVYLTDNNLGFVLPPADNGYGGSDLYDVYIGGETAGAAAIEGGTYGFVSPEDSLGDNTETDQVEKNSYTSWMCMNYDYSWLSESITPGKVDTAVSVTVAHEFMHAIQMSYNVEMEGWFKEACATWAEDALFPGYDDNFQYLMDLFSRPDVALNLDNWTDNLGDSPLANHWYCSWIFIKYLTEQTENSAIRHIYEAYLDKGYASGVVDNVLKSKYSTSFNQIFDKFLIANLLLTSDQKYAPYNYVRGDAYSDYVDNNGELRFENQISYNGTDNADYSSETNGNGRLMRLSADYIMVLASQDFNITLTPQSQLVKLNAIVFALNSETGDFRVDTLKPKETGLALNVDYTSKYNNFVLLVNRYDDSNDTLSAQYNIVVSSIKTSLNNFSKTTVSVYPNPVVDQLFFKNADNITNGQIKIYDYTGKLVVCQEYNSKLDVSKLNKGLYILEVTAKNKILFKDKFVKN